MNIFNRLGLGNLWNRDSNIQQLLKVIDQSSGDKAALSALSRQVKSIFQDKTETLIGELMTDPQQRKNWREMGSRLRQVDPQLFKDMQSSIGSIQKIATLLKKDDAAGLDRFTDLIEKEQNQIGGSNNLVFSHVAAHFHSLKLPGDLAQVRSISHHEVRTHVLANLINRDRIPLAELDLSKEEMMAIAPHLTYVDCGNLFLTSYTNGVPSGRFANWTADAVHHFLDKCLNAEVLKISSHHITRLPPLSKCTELYCTAMSLKELPELPNCQILHCDTCSSLEELPDLPNCKTLNLFFCNRLTRLSGLNNCEEVKVSSCETLIQIEGLANCRHLDCRFCPALSQLPELPVCEILHYLGCDALDMNSIPDRFRQQYSYLSAVSAERLQVKVDELQQNPMNILLGLGDSLLQGQGMPKIKFIEQDGREAGGIDAGGLRRILLSRLMKALISHSATPGQLPFEKEEFGVLPVLKADAEAIENQIKGFRTLGALFAHCLESGDVTGQVFDPLLFRMIAACPFEELDKIDLDTKEVPDAIWLSFLAADPYNKVAIILQTSPENLTEDDLATLIETGKISELFEGPDVPDLKQDPLPLETKQWLHHTLKQYVFEASKGVKDDLFLAVLLIAKQMQALAGTTVEWDQLRIRGAEGFLQVQIEGLISKEAILEAIEPRKSHEGLDEDKYNHTKDEYVERWIKEAKPEELQNLLFTLTGAPALPNGKKLAFRFYDSGNPQRLPTVHTCSFEIDIPVNYPTFEIFKEKWELMIAQSINPAHSGVEES